MLSFNELVRCYQTLIYHTAYRVLRNAEAAEDATQDALISAYRHLRSFRGGSFKAWLVRIVTNGCYNQFRERRRMPGMSLEELSVSGQDLTPLSASPEDFAERCELGNLIQRGLGTMASDQRVTLVLADIDELPYREIASITRVNIGTVKSRLARARARLRDYLLEQEDIVPGRYRHPRARPAKRSEIA